MSLSGDDPPSPRAAAERPGAPFFWFAVVFLAAVVVAVAVGSVLFRPHANGAPPASPIPPVTDAPRPGSGQGPSGLGPGGGAR